MKKFLTTVFAAVIATFIFNFSTDSVKAVYIENKCAVIENVCADYNSNNEKLVFGYSKKSFDLDDNEKYNIFDLILLKQELENDDPGITENTVIKFTNYLIGISDTLEITETEPFVLNEQSEDIDFTIQNLMSNDFTLIACSPYQFRISENATKPSIKLNFLGIDEYVLESLVIYNICPSYDKLESIITENSCFAIGVIENEYYLAPLSPSEPEENVYSSTEYPPAYIKYNFADQYFVENNPDATVLLEQLKNQLNSRDYEYTVKKDDFYNITVTAKAEDSCVTIIACSVYPFDERETLFKNDYFELFYCKLGYGISIFENTTEENVEFPPANAKYDFTDANIDLESVSSLIEPLRNQLSKEGYEFTISLDDYPIVKLTAVAENSNVEILVQKTTEQVGGEVILETDEFKLIFDDFGIGIILN